MRSDKSKSRLSIIATVISIVLILIYWLAPADGKSHPIYKLFIDCIPDSLIVLITIPIVYWLFYTRGLTNMGDCPLFMGHSITKHGSNQLNDLPISMNLTQRPNIKNVTDDQHNFTEQDILFVPILQDKSTEHLNIDTITTTLNTTLRLAETKKMSIVFIKFFLPIEQPSMEQDFASQPDILTIKTTDTELPDGLCKPAGIAVLSFFLHSRTLESSLKDNAVLNMLFFAPRVGDVYIAGMAPIECFEVLFHIALKSGKKTIGLRNAIMTSDDDIKRSKKMWNDLISEGVIMQDNLS